MNILYITQYFPPDKGAAQARAWDTVKILSSSGHRVTVLTEFPNYPSGIVLPRYKLRCFEKEMYRGVSVIRVYVKASPRRNFVNRMLFYLSFFVFSIIAAMKLKDKYDLVFATSPPLFAAISGYTFSKLRRTRFVFEVRDLWVESAVALGELRNRAFVRLSKGLADLCYQGASKIVVVTRGIRDYLEQRGIPPDRLCVIPNGVDLSSFDDFHDRKSHKRGLSHQDKFIVLYAGLFGLAQGIETLVETVKLMRYEEKVLFLLIGNGPLKEKLAQSLSSNGLNNVRLIDVMPREEVFRYIASADCCLVPLKKIDIFKTALPSKMFDAWACSKPIILSVDGEAREHLEKAKAGIWVEPENPNRIAQAIKYLFDNPEMCKRFGSNGREYVEKNFSRKVQAERLERILLEVLSESNG